MAATSAPTDAADLVYRLANKPALIGMNALQLVSGIANLVTNQDGRISQPDVSAAGFDRKYLINRMRHNYWKAGSAGVAHYIIADVGAVDAARKWNVLILEHDSTLNGKTLRVYGDDAVTPAAGGPGWGAASIIFGPTVLGSGPYTVLFHATSDWSPRFLRLELTAGAGFQPQIRQAWLGFAMQLPAKSDYGSQAWEALEAGDIEHETKSGIIWSYEVRPALAARQQRFRFGGSPSDTFFTNLRNFFKSANSIAGGIRPFFYCENPTANPSDVQFVKWKGPKTFDPVEISSFVQEWRLVYREMGGGA